MSKNDNDRRKSTERVRGSSTRGSSGSAQASKRTSAASKPKPRKKTKDGKNKYIAFYVITLIIAVGVCLMTFWFVYSQISGGMTNEPVERPNITAQAPPDVDDDDDDEPPVLAVEEIALTGVIVSAQQNGRTLEILDIDSLAVLSFTADNLTTLQGRAGESMSFAQFRTGDIVDARFRVQGEPLTSISLTPNAWEYRNVDGVVVNIFANTLTVGENQAMYRFGNQTIALFDNETFDIVDIHPMSVVTIRGIDSDIWFVEMSRGTGFINIVNGQNIRDGVVEIASNATVQLNADGTTENSEPVRVTTGNRQIFISGSNIHDFNTSIDVSAGEQAILDLSVVQFLAGVVSFNISEPGATITVNGTPRQADEPLILDYGRHELVVTREGFITYERAFELNSPTMDVVVTLERDVNRINVSVFTTNATTGEPLMGARVYFDNAFIGLTPISALVEEGDRMLSIQKEGFGSISFMTDGRPRYDISLQENVPIMPPTP